jgi:hypothetical protein
MSQMEKCRGKTDKEWTGSKGNRIGIGENKQIWFYTLLIKTRTLEGVCVACCGRPPHRKMRMDGPSNLDPTCNPLHQKPICFHGQHVELHSLAPKHAHRPLQIQ